MKNKIVSFLLTCILIFISLLYSCSSKDESNNADKNTSKVEREKVTNVFKTNWISLPENYTVSATVFVVSNDRIYMLGQPENDTAERRPALISYNSEGGDMQLEETPYDDVINFTILSDGSIVYLLSVYNSASLTNEYWLNKVDTSGNEAFSVNVSAMIPKSSENSGYYGEGVISDIALDSEDRIYLKEAMSVLVVSPDTGERLFYHSDSSSINNIVQVGGKVAVRYPNAEFKYINADEGKIGDSVYVPKNLDISGYQVYSAPSDGDSGILYYYNTVTGLYSVSESDSDTTELVNWMNSDISPSVLSAVTVINNDRMCYTYFDKLAGGMAMTALVRIPYDEIVPKYVIEIAYIKDRAQDNLLDIAAKFSQRNEDYRVNVIDYKQLSGDLEGDELTSFINRQFAIGNIPDMFLISSQLTGKEYEDKGLFFDLYEYLDNDSDISRDDFLKCVLPSGEVDGKLYYMLNYFSVNTVVGKTENIGDIKGWSISDFLDIAQNRTDGAKILLNLSNYRNNVYTSLIKQGLSEFIDYESGTCSFNSDLFIRLLNYLGGLSEPAGVWQSSDAVQKEFRENMILLNNANINEFIEYIRQGVIFGTEALTFAGYPGNGEKISVSSAYAISAKSEKEIRDGAWTFIKYTLMNSDILSSIDRFPATYDAFYKFAERKMKGYYLIGPWYTTSGSSVEFTQEQIAANQGGIQVRITQDDVDEVLAYLESIEKTPDVDTKIYEIIDEEMQYFFAGAKSAEETANLIQSRVSIYISESH